MGRKYQQLSLDDRCEIARRQANGQSIQKIAAALDRAPSTIAREIRRNRGRQVGYKPSYAQEQTQARRWSGSRLEHDPDLRRVRTARLRLVPRTGRRTPRPRTRPQGHQLRDHLLLHLRPDRTHQGLLLAPLPATRKKPTGPAKPQSESHATCEPSSAPPRNARGKPSPLTMVPNSPARGLQAHAIL
jgi:hypothetical protein